MFIPKHFKVTDLEEIREFIQKKAFGTMVTTKEGKPIATHLPLELHQQGEDYFITGHLAYANPQVETLKNPNENVLLIYQGPHAYISSSWYKTENVPTWNYQSVHIYGTPSILNEQELEADLKLLLEKYEQHRPNPVLWENLSTQTKKQMKGIVGFKIKVQEIQAAYKLSQNRNEEDYQRILDHLEEEDDLNSRAMVEVMRKRR